MAFLCCCSPFSRSRMPDLSLSLISPSNTFLNGIIVDRDTRKAIYSIDTIESRTSIIRETAPTAAHRARESRAPSHTGSGLVASVLWPERSPHIIPLRPGAPPTTASAPAANLRRGDHDSARIDLDDGSLIPLPRFLKRRSQSLVGTVHKFRIPGYPATFKWKRNGPKYQLRATGIRSLLAEVRSDTLTASLELAIYGAFIPSHHNQDQPGSVASVLLDYTVLTALLLVTPLREWTRFSHHVRSVGRVSGAWGDGEGGSEGESDTDEWEEPSRFRWGGARSHGHGHGHEHGHERQQHQRQDDQRRGGGERCGGIGEDDVAEWEATSDEMRQVATATLFTASQFARRRRSVATIASTDSGRTLVTPCPPIVLPTVHTTGGSAAHAQEAVRRALAMDLERDLGDYPSDLCGGL